MNKLIFPTLVILLLSSCQNQEDKASRSTQSAGNENSGSEKVLELPYNAEYNKQTQKLELKHNIPVDASKLTIGDMIDAINLKYPEIKLQLVSTDHHTVYVKIDDATYLSESLGSTGSKTYIAEATFALTEIPGIKVVDFAFKEGNHAAPGVYTRADFKGFN